MGGIADHPPHRKRLLLAFAALGSCSAILFLVLPSSSPVWPFVAPLAICANVGFGASMVALNAYIPTLAQGAQEVVTARADLVRLSGADTSESAHERPDRDSAEGAEEPLLAHEDGGDSTDVHAARAAHDKILSATTSRISSQGIALGYSAGIVMLLLTLIPVRAMKGSTDALRLAVGLSGLWWALFSLPAAALLPGASAVAAAQHRDATLPPDGPDADWRISREVVRAWKRLGRMLRWREIKRLRNTFVYLAAWFLLSDGFTTITSTALLFAKTTLHMPPSSLILIGVLSPTAGILGSLVWPMIQRKMGWSNLRIIVTLVGMAVAIPAYGCLGFLPVFKQSNVKFGGLTTPGEMYFLAVYFVSICGKSDCLEPAHAKFFAGIGVWCIPGLCPRVLRGVHSPRRRGALVRAILHYGQGESDFLVDRRHLTAIQSSSFVGPLVVGLIADTTGNIRYSFFFLVIMILLAVPVLMVVDVEHGREDAQRYVSRSSHD